jgi:HAD superfamily 5'-nucleotidase-like hydrolase
LTDRSSPPLAAPPISPEIALLRYALAGAEPPPSRRVFVNRALRMERIRCIGFDLDWTIAPYYRLPIEELIFELALDRLVRHFDYPTAVRHAEFRPHFPHRGVIVDREAGVVLKMDRHRYVGRAYLGREQLDGTARGKLYRQERLDLRSERFYWVDTLFELPEVNLLAELVELSHRGKLADPPSYSKLFADVRASVDGVHAEGPLKARIAADLPRFLPRDRDLALALVRMQLPERKLILVTNSDFAYTDKLCSYLFDGVLPGLASWRELFALVIVSARKPGFFRKRKPFVELDGDGHPRREVEAPSWGGVYAGGSRWGLEDLMQIPGESFLYVGDHIYGDIVSSKLTSTWRTALVLSELEEELEKQQEQAPQLRHLDALKGELSAMGGRMDDLRDVLGLYGRHPAEEAEGAQAAARQRLEQLQGEHRALRRRAGELEEQIATRYNPTWGSVFKQGGSQSLFGSQVDDFSCIYTSRVANFAYYGTNHYFRVLKDPMAHDVDL